MRENQHRPPTAPGRPRVVVDVSGHGFGHAGQLAPILALLHARRPGLAFVVRSALEPGALASVLRVPFTSHEAPPDRGLSMHDPVTVDREASRAWYDSLERAFDRLVEEDAARLRSLAPDLLVSNIGFLGLAAAARVGVPAVAVCSLTWPDIARAYGVASAAMLERMRDAHRAARLTVQLEPHLAMEWLEPKRSVGPVARTGRPRRAELEAALGCPPATRIVLVAFGGIAMPRLLVEPPPIPGVLWLGDRVRGPGLATTERVGLPFPDLLASVDLLLTKTGYGLFAEAAAAGTPLLYLERPDWPEAPFLERWIREQGIGAPLPRDPEALVAAVQAMLARPRPAAVTPTGIAEAVALIERFL